MQPAEQLLAGIAILDPIMAPRGFRFAMTLVDRGSGGDFATGSYVRDDRQLELHFRRSLGLVTYRVQALVMAHEDLTYVQQARLGRAQYPGFSDDPLDGFRHLRSDLERFGVSFLDGTDAQVRELFAHAAAHPRPTGFRAISGPPAV